MSTYTTHATVTLSVNGKDAEETLAKLKQRASDYRDAIATAAKEGNKAELKKLRKELKATEREIKSIQSASANVADVMRRLDTATPKELKSTLKHLTNELKNLERGTKAWDEQTEKIRRVKKELEDVNSTISAQRTGWEKISDWVNKWQTLLLGAVAAVSQVVTVARGAVQAFADWDAALANTQKFTGMSREEVEQLNEEFKKMDTRTSIEGLNELAQAAGRLGKNSIDDVMGFVRAGDIIGVAMDELGTDAPQIISQLSSIFNLESELGTEKAMLSVGSAINTLSQNCAASAPNLVEFAGRLGAIASSSNMTMDEMLAFGALLDDQKVSIEKASTAIQGVMTKMYADPSDFAKKACLDATEFTEALKSSSTEGIMMFVESLSRMDQMEQAATLKGLGAAGAGVVQTFQTLAGKVDLLKEQMQISKSAFEDATSATEEFNVQNNTVQARLDKAKKSFNAIRVELGEQLLPVMQYVTSGTSILIKTISSVVNFVIEYRKVLLVLTGTIVAYTIAANAAAIKTKALAMWQGIVKAATVAWTGATYLSAAAIAIFTGKVTRATAALRAFSAVTKLSPIGLLVGTITAVVAVLTLWITRTKELTTAQEQLQDIEKKAHESSLEELTTLRLLYEASQDQKRSIEERTTAVQKLQEKYPDYFGNLSTETILAGKAADEYNRLTTSILNSARAKARQEQLVSNEQEILRLENERDQKVNAALDDMSLNYQDKNFYAPTRKNKLMLLDWMPIEGKSEYLITKQYIDKVREDYNKKISHYRYLNDTISKLVADNMVKSNNSGSGGKTIGSDQLTNAVAQDGDNETTTTSSEDRFMAEKQWREREEAINRIAYATGKKLYQDYTKRMNEIEVQYYEKLKDHKEATANEQLQFEAQYYEAVEKQQETHNAIALDAENARYNDVVTDIKQKFMDGKIKSTEAYHKTLELAELIHKERLVYIYEEGTDERLNAEKDYQDALLDDQMKKQKEMEQKVADFQKKYTKKTASEKMTIELEAINALYAQRLIAEQKYQEAKAQIAEEYIGGIRKEHATPKERLSNAFADNDKSKELIETAMSQGLISAEEYTRRMAELQADMHETIADSLKNTGNEWITMFANVYGSFAEFMAALEGDSTGMIEKLSNLMGATSAIVVASMQLSAEFAKAEADIQIAALEKRYDKEISLAEGNAYKVAKLEKQKEKEIAKIKNEANKKQYTAQIVQAVAQSITAGLNAYASTLAIPIVGPALAPAAMALALATGMLQVALLKKQQKAAEAQGYSKGGFTPKGAVNEEVGVVHAGEWVASQKLLANPVARPLINALDYAQRTNTIGSLKAQDVSRSITAPAVIASSSTGTAVSDSLTAQAIALAGYTSVIRRLNERLDEPFVTVNTVTGDSGIKKAQDDYDKLIRNKTPKSKRKS